MYTMTLYLQSLYKYGTLQMYGCGIKSYVDICHLSVCHMLHRGSFLLYGNYRQAAHNTISSIARNMQVPFISLSTPVNVSGQDSTGFMLYMEPLYTRAILDVINHKQWTSIHYIYDNEGGKQAIYIMYCNYDKEAGKYIYKKFVHDIICYCFVLILASAEQTLSFSNLTREF